MGKISGRIFPGLSNMLIIGLTGGLGTGKSTVAKIFAGYGAKVIDADEIVHTLMRPHTRTFKKIVERFGPDILINGLIDRRKLAGVVFQDFRKLSELTAIVHPEALRQVKRMISSFKKKNVRAVVIDAPLLIEAGWDRTVDVLVVVKANRALQFKRIQKRMHLTRSQIQRRIAMQMSMREKIRKADFVVDNRGSLEQTRKQVKEIINVI